MDEQTRALYQQLLGELYRRMEKDPEIRRALKRIEEGKATFRDTAVWSDRSAELLGTVFSEAIGDMPAEARESLCKALLRERYDSTFDLCGEVQEALDERLGISLKPVKPKFPAERVQQIAHSLLDPTVAAAVIERRARAPVATAARSFHDDYIRENASARTDLGFKCYLDRIAAPGCCKWCTSVAGKYIYGSHPDDIFRRHDNCACTVTFENGRERQDVWSKRTWQEDPAEVQRLAQEPVVYTQEEAKIVELKQVVETGSRKQALDFFAKGGILEGGYDEQDIIRAITQVGTNFVTKDVNDPESIYGELVESIPPDPKYYDIKAHGSPVSVKLFGSVVDAQTLARVIVLREDYTGKPIRLLCCETGKEDGAETCFAQQLADLLDVDVLAPTESIYASSFGNIKVRSDETGKKGIMKPFTPNKRGRR